MDNNRIKSTPLVSREQVSQYVRTGNVNFKNGENKKDKEGIKSFGNVPTKIVLDRDISRKIKSVIAAVALAGIILTPLTVVQEIGRAKAQEVVYTAEVPDEFDRGLDYTVEEQYNGESFYVDPEGRKYHTYNEIPAEEMIKITKGLGLGEYSNSESIDGLKR